MGNGIFKIDRSCLAESVRRIASYRPDDFAFNNLMKHSEYSIYSIPITGVNRSSVSGQSYVFDDVKID